ncbi:MAG: SxtJ family membrane protein [Phycisphaerae bacterium]
MALVEVNWTPSTRELKQFATIWFPAFFTLVAAVVLYHTGSLRVALMIWCAALVAGLVGCFVPRIVRLVFTVWMCAVYPIGWVISHAVLIAVFALVITPIGLLMRLMGRDALDRTFDRSAKTYWRPCRRETNKTHYLRQF